MKLSVRDSPTSEMESIKGIGKFQRAKRKSHFAGNRVFFVPGTEFRSPESLRASAFVRFHFDRYTRPLRKRVLCITVSAQKGM